MTSLTPFGGKGYVVMHLVAGESMKDLIGSQVIDHMVTQATCPGEDAPLSVTVGLLEPARVVVRPTFRRRHRELNQRAGNAVKVQAMPFISRFGVPFNARRLAGRIRATSGGHPLVLHCRTESAVRWAAAMRPYCAQAAIVADIRGIWAEEWLFAQGVDGPTQATDSQRAGYDSAMRELDYALDASDEVTCVSGTMSSWLQANCTPRVKPTVVPCCVRRITFDPERRAAMRRELGFGDELVLAYAGTVTRYQHVEDGIMPFLAAAMASEPRVRFLCVTTAPDHFNELLARHRLANRSVVMRVPQPLVADYLSAADAGLLLRADSRMNRVSMPVKLGEYLASGLPVVASRVPGWIDEIVTSNGAGISVRCFGVTADVLREDATFAVRKLLERAPLLRERAIELCQREFLWTAHVPRMRGVYTHALEAARRRHTIQQAG